MMFNVPFAEVKGVGRQYFLCQRLFADITASALQNPLIGDCAHIKTAIGRAHWTCIILELVVQPMYKD